MQAGGGSQGNVRQWGQCLSICILLAPSRPSAHGQMLFLPRLLRWNQSRFERAWHGRTRVNGARARGEQAERCRKQGCLLFWKREHRYCGEEAPAFPGPTGPAAETLFGREISFVPINNDAGRNGESSQGAGNGFLCKMRLCTRQCREPSLLPRPYSLCSRGESFLGVPPWPGERERPQ